MCAWIPFADAVIHKNKTKTESVAGFCELVLERMIGRLNDGGIIKIHEPENYRCVIFTNAVGAKYL